MKRKLIFIITTLIFLMLNFNTFDSHAENKPTINVLSYGISNDGQTDCSTQLNNLFSTYPNHSFYFPAGNYLLCKTVYIPSNIVLTGEGINSLFIAKQYLPIGSTLFYINNKTNITFDKISISGNIKYNSKSLGYNTKDGIHLLDIWNSNTINISNCNFIDNGYAAIRAINSNNINTTSCNFNNVDCGFITLGHGNISNVTISDNYFNGHEHSEPISLYASALHTNITIQNNIIENKKYASGIYVGDTGSFNQIVITENKISNCSNGICVKNCSNTIIYNNTIQNTSSGSGIKISDCNSTVVFNNSIYNVQQDGISINSCNNSSIYNNSITYFGLQNNNFVGIRVKGQVNILEVHDNAMISNKSSVGIYLNNLGQSIVSNNKLSNCMFWISSICDNSVVSMNRKYIVRNDSPMININYY